MHILLHKSLIYFFLGYTVRIWTTELQLLAAQGFLLEQEILLWNTAVGHSQVHSWAQHWKETANFASFWQHTRGVLFRAHISCAFLWPGKPETPPALPPQLLRRATENQGNWVMWVCVSSVRTLLFSPLKK